MTEMQLRQLKRDLPVDVSDARTQMNYKPLRTFHTINNPALLEEMTSPGHKAIMHIRQRDDGRPQNDSPTYNNRDLDLTNTQARDISPTERQLERIVRDVQYPDDSTILNPPKPEDRGARMPF